MFQSLFMSITVLSISANADLVFDGNWGSWVGIKLCPVTTNNYIWAFQTQVESPQGAGDDTAMNGVQFTCSKVGGTLRFTGSWGTYETTLKTCINGFTGAMVKMEGKQYGNDDTAMNGLSLYCPSSNSWIEGKSGPWGSWSQAQFCPAGQKIYGANVRQEGKQGSGDDTAMNGISFLCR